MTNVTQAWRWTREPILIIGGALFVFLGGGDDWAVEQLAKLDVETNAAVLDKVAIAIGAILGRSRVSPIPAGRHRA